MPRFVGERDERTVQAPWWAEKEVCVIRRYGYGVTQQLAGETVKVGIRPGQDEEAIGDVAIGRMNLAILEAGIVGWTDAEGAEVPVTAGRIAALEPEDAEFILGEIAELNPRRRRSPEEQEMFRGGD